MTQSWSDGALISVDDDWSAVPGFTGTLRLAAGPATGPIDPRTLLTSLPVTAVKANRSDPSLALDGGIAEFALPNPVVAISGGGSVEAASLVLFLDLDRLRGVVIGYTARDIEGAPSGSDAVSPVSLQYMFSVTPFWQDVPSGFIEDASAGPQDVKSTVVLCDPLLPEPCEDDAWMLVRWVVAKAASEDEWIGIDDITVTALPCQPLVPAMSTSWGALKSIYR